MPYLLIKFSQIRHGRIGIAVYQIHAPTDYGIIFEETMTRRCCASVPISNYSSLPIHYLLVLCIHHTYYFIHTADEEHAGKDTMLMVHPLHCFFLSLAWSLSGDNVAPSRHLAFSTVY